MWSASSAVLWLLWQASPLLAIAFGVAVPAAAIGLVSRVVLRESIDEWVRRSASGFPATTLGL